MKAIILAAGNDDSLGKISRGVPKCMVEIEGNSLLEIQVNTLHVCGIENITVVRGYEHKKIDIPGLNYYENSNFQNTNVLYSLFCARQEMDDDVLILYSDILYEEKTLQRMLSSKEDIALGVMVNLPGQLSDEEIKKKEMVYFDAKNRVTSVGKNMVDEYETQGQFVGMVKCSKWGIEILKRNYSRAANLYAGKPFGRSEEFKKAWLTDIFSEMVDLGVSLHCIIIERGWLEINNEEDYERARTDTQFVRRMIEIKTNWENRSETYNKLHWVNRDETLSAMVQMAGNLDGKKVLDAGTGTGKVLIALKKKYPRGIYHGFDVSQGMINKIDPSYGFHISINEIENIDHLTDDYFDLVTARMVLHHVSNLDIAIQSIHRILKPDGSFIICEGNPPDRHSLAFYEDMFRFKENRHTFLMDDIVNVLHRNGFREVTCKSIHMKEMSLNNWLNNSGIPFRNMDIINRMHYECADVVKKSYNMREEGDDIMMDWKFSVVKGVK